ncbi:MAG: hypothetical protein ACOVO2_17720 [Emticicia sp.]|uniref:hypothetical protein n=1 Tax=Emticicia sp. TaxID=1930953 RepID=UPI003BA6837A
MKAYKFFIIIGLSMLFLIACAGETVLLGTGSLDIKVTIGPLCSTEPCNRPVEDIRKVYEAYTFTVTDTKLNKQVLEKQLTYNGTNGVLKSTSLTAGEYELSIKPETIFTKKSFPQTFKIEKDKTTSLEINIDTGLR